MMQPVRRILVTGAAGFVGRHLVATLRRTFPGAVLALDYFDITDAAATRHALQAAAPDACVHLAGIATLSAARQDPSQAWQVNLHGTLNLADSILAAFPDCRLLFVSSGEIYGRSFQSGQPVDETVAPAPMNTYAATKAAADLAIGARVSDGLRAIRVRPFNHTGPGQMDNFVVAAFARQLARIAAGMQPPVLQAGALDPQRDFLDVRDVCAAYAACLQQPDSVLPPGTILNLASGTPRRIGDVLRQMCALADVKAEITTNAGLLRPTEIPIACGNATKAHRLLGWTPAIPWEQTLHDVIDDWRHRIQTAADC